MSKEIIGRPWVLNLIGAGVLLSGMSIGMESRRIVDGDFGTNPSKVQTSDLPEEYYDAMKVAELAIGASAIVVGEIYRRDRKE